MKESQTIEFKRCITENLKYEVIAFANTAGGTIYIGIDDDGTPVGIEDMDESMLSVTNTIRDSILPDITLFTDVREAVIGGKPVIEIMQARDRDHRAERFPASIFHQRQGYQARRCIYTAWSILSTGITFRDTKDDQGIIR